MRPEEGIDRVTTETLYRSWVNAQTWALNKLGYIELFIEYPITRSPEVSMGEWLSGNAVKWAYDGRFNGTC